MNKKNHMALMVVLFATTIFTIKCGQNYSFGHIGFLAKNGYIPADSPADTDISKPINGGTGGNPDPNPQDPPVACDGGLEYGAPLNAGKNIFVVHPDFGKAEKEFLIFAANPGYQDVFVLKSNDTGLAQPDESGTFLIKNATNPAGFPSNPNCLSLFIAADNNNNSTNPVDQYQYWGRFWFDQGINTVTFIHYCKIYLELMSTIGSSDPGNACFSFHNGTCEGPNVNGNSVHVGAGYGICSQSTN
ncbi:MAG: hypothetical protein R3A11_06010 [Bdellovibrionota bacterium]